MQEENPRLISINFNDVQVIDLDGAKLIVKDFAKICANGLFTSVPTIELSDAVRELHAGKSVELTTQEIQFFIQVFRSKKVLLPFAQVPLIAYLEGKLVK